MMLSGAVNNNDEDSGVLLLRNWLLKGPIVGQSGRSLVRRKTERALRAFLDRERLAKLYEIETPTLFLLPEEAAAAKRTHRKNGR